MEKSLYTLFFIVLLFNSELAQTMQKQSKDILIEELIAVNDDGVINFPEQVFNRNFNFLNKQKDPKTMSFKNPRWYYSDLLDKNENQLLQEAKSRFVSPDFHISDWATHAEKKLINFRRSILFTDIENKIYPDTGPLSHIFKHNLQYYQLTIPQRADDKKAYFKGLKQEVLNGAAHRYKIHLQIKPEYYASFMNDFITFIKTNSHLRNIAHFKFTNSFKPGENYYKKRRKAPKNAIPIIVLYVCLLPGTKDQKNDLLQEIIQAIIDRYEDYLDEAHLPIKPRFNRHIKGFIYLAGGDGDDKEELYIRRNEIRSRGYRFSKIKKSIYTKDWAFFRGYEYDRRH